MKQREAVAMLAMLKGRSCVQQLEMEQLGLTVLPCRCIKQIRKDALLCVMILLG